MPYLVRRLRRMDLTFFAVHSQQIAGRQRGINVDSWLVPYLPFSIPVTVKTRYRHVDSGKIVEENRPLGRLQKNVRLHGQMVRGAGYSRYSEGDILLLQFSDQTVTWAVFQDAGNESPVFDFLSDAHNVEYRRSMGVVREQASVAALQNLLSRYDAALFFTDEIEALETEPSSISTQNYIRRRVSRLAFENLQRAREENGTKGELFVLERERARLRESGHPELAEKVKHVSAEDPTAPFDILSFDGTAAQPELERFIEVKSTSTTGMEFEISEAEWEFARQKGDQYYLYRVTQVTSGAPGLVVIRNLHAFTEAGRAERRPSAFKVRVLQRP